MLKNLTEGRMGSSNFVVLIKEVAKENKFIVKGQDTNFEIYKDLAYSMAFRLFKNNQGYLQAHVWEGEEKDGEYGYASYSIRSATDAVNFCQILLLGDSIRAKRHSGW